MQQSLSINDVQSCTGLGRTKIYSLIGTGELKARKLGKRTFVLKSDLEDFLNNLESYPSENQEAK